MRHLAVIAVYILAAAALERLSRALSRAGLAAGRAMGRC